MSEKGTKSEVNPKDNISKKISVGKASSVKKKKINIKANTKKMGTKIKARKKTAEKTAAEKGAAEKTAAEKTAAEKAAAEKGAAEKAAAEKAAAEKAAAEKAAAEKAAAEKAAAEKAAAEKAAAEKAAAEKAAAEKAAAEKAAAEKAAAEKAAAEKAAAEKAAAEKAAAEKAAAEKAAAEKAAAEKAAAEKAAAEKAAAEKAAAEKAAAEKAAAEKAAAEKAAAEKKKLLSDNQKNITPVSIACEDKKTDLDNKIKCVCKENNPLLSSGIKLFIASLSSLVILIIIASILNGSKYYLINENENTEVWKGTFSPLGKKCLEILENTGKISTNSDYKKSHSKEEVFPIIFEYYSNKAETLLSNNNSSFPDFKNIRFMLIKAIEYSSPKTVSSNNALTRLNTIDRIIYICRADIISSLGTLEGFDKAIILFNKAKKLASSERTMEFIMKRIAMCEEGKTKLISN